MDRKVIPFLPARFESFVGLVFIFGMIGSIIHFIPLHHNKKWKIKDIVSNEWLRWVWEKKIPLSSFMLIWSWPWKIRVPWKRSAKPDEEQLG